MKSIKGFFDLPTLISFFLGIVIYVIGIYPVLQSIINTALPTMDANSGFFLQLAPAVFFLAMFVSVFQYAFGNKGAGAEQQTR